MQRILSAMVLSAALQPALAGPPASTPAHPDAIVQAQLVVPAEAAPGAPAQAGTAKATSAHADEERRPAGMLLAAFVLMSGIALRRWWMARP